ncbi:hypothetical protein BKA65DRAFT_386691 [Rhexocercosporidium sp. MPI-PUGE-AT-0058]|nr:hypothetical protein BKA65DRAFT_386691 [Rhexocercosporidium sp. MPI-PUGE-AT-0058]
MVTIYVSPKKKRWIIHEAVICNKSTYLRNAFQSPFTEGTSKTITLQGEDAAVFNLFVSWLYGATPRRRCTWSGDDSDSWKYHMVLYGLDIFADKICSQPLRDFVSDSYSEWMDERPDFMRRVEEIEMVYEECPAFATPFRLYIMDDVLRGFFNPEFDDFESWGDITSCSKAFAGELRKELREHMEVPWDCCYYSGCVIHEAASKATSRS